MMPRIRACGRRLALVATLSVIGALSFGVAYGDVRSNQPTYLPKGLQLADPAFLAHDWWLNQTVQYHVAFSRLVELLVLAGAPRVAMAIANTALIAATLLVVHRIVLRLGAGSAAFLAWSIVTGVFLLGLGATSVSATYLFSAGLQPSTIASFAFVLGILWYLEGRDGLSGLVLGLGGAFHANFAIIGLAAFGLAQLASPRRGLMRRLALQLGPMALVLAANLPLILAMDGGGTAEDKRLAADIFFDVAEPFHYAPLSYLPLFLPFLAWQVLALLDLAALPAGPARRRMAALYFAMLAIIAAAFALTSVVFVAPVARAFLFRLNPFAVLLAAIVVAIAAARRLAPEAAADPRAAPDAPGPASGAALALVRLAAALVIAVFALVIPQNGLLRCEVILLPLAVAALLPLLAAPRRGGRAGWLALLGRHGRLVGSALVLAAAGAQLNAQNFTLLPGHQDADHTAGLYRWAASTPPATRFLTPPDLMDFRFAAGRSIVVDRKAVPQGTLAVLEWYRRMEDVSGRPGFRSLDDATEGYRTMDATRLDTLARKYHTDYAVLPNTGAARALGGDVAYSDPWFLVVHCE